MCGIEVGFAQAVITGVDVAEFDLRLALQFLDEVAMPVQTGIEAAQRALEPGNRS